MNRAILAIFLLFALLPSCDQSSCQPPPNRILNLCRQVVYSESSHLTSTELNSFEELTKDFSLSLLVDTLSQLERPKDDFRTIPTHPPGTPIEETADAWEAPADILIGRVIAKEQNPETLHEIIYDPKILTRGSFKLVRRLGKHHPKLACEILEYHYQKFVPVWGVEILEADYYFTSGVFKAMNSREDRLGMMLLEEDFFKEQPFTTRLQQEALKGILESSDTERRLCQFIDWLHINSERLPIVVGSMGFRNFSPLFPLNGDLRSRALIRLSRRSPTTAVQWARQNTRILPEDWPLDIVNGWIHFRADHPDKIPAYDNKWQDALAWLIENHPKYSDRTANALKCINLSETSTWDQSPKRNAQIEAFKVKLQQTSKR